MARRRRTKWAVVTTALDNGELAAYGPWLDYDKAKEIDRQISATSTYYNGEEGIFDIQVHIVEIEPWPGIRAFKRDE